MTPRQLHGGEEALPDPQVAPGATTFEQDAVGATLARADQLDGGAGAGLAQGRERPQPLHRLARMLIGNADRLGDDAVHSEHALKAGGGDQRGRGQVGGERRRGHATASAAAAPAQHTARRATVLHITPGTPAPPRPSSRTPKPVPPLSKYGVRPWSAVAGDVQVGPRHVADEVVQELGRGDGQCHPRLGTVGDLGVAALDHLGVLAVKRQPPHQLAGALAASDHQLGQAIVVGHHPGVGRPQRRDHPAGQGRDVDDRLAPGPAGMGDAIGQHHAPLGVGVVDLDRGAVERPRPCRRA